METETSHLLLDSKSKPGEMGKKLRPPTVAPWNRDVLAEVHEDCVTGRNLRIFSHDSLGKGCLKVHFECQFLNQTSIILYILRKQFPTGHDRLCIFFRGVLSP